MDNPKSTVLDLGCGPTKRPGAIGVDIAPGSAADIHHDLNRFPYPFPDNAFETIFCENILEHLDNIPAVMEEIHRIARPGGTISIVVPFFGHRNAYTDPTHRHFFGVHSFDYFVEGTPHAKFGYSAARFRVASVRFNDGISSRHWFDRAIVRFANRNPDLYENRFAHLIPLQQLSFLLTAMKA